MESTGRCAYALESQHEMYPFDPAALPWCMLVLVKMAYTLTAGLPPLPAAYCVRRR